MGETNPVSRGGKVSIEDDNLYVWELVYSTSWSQDVELEVSFSLITIMIPVPRSPASLWDERRGVGRSLPESPGLREIGKYF